MAGLHVCTKTLLTPLTKTEVAVNGCIPAMISFFVLYKDPDMLMYFSDKDKVSPLDIKEVHQKQIGIGGRKNTELNKYMCMYLYVYYYSKVPQYVDIKKE